MLSESSYQTALYVYTGAAGVIMVCLGWWLARRWGAGMVAFAVLLAGALLLTPAHPREGVDTFAPALVVLAFQWMTEGLDGALHALRPLGFMSGAATVLALLLRFTVFRRPRKRARQADKKAAAPG